MAMSFIFGGKDMPQTPQELARMRAMAEALSPRRTPKDAGEGIASIGNAILYRALMNRADGAEKAGIDKANSAFDSLFSSPDSVTATSADASPIDTPSAPTIKSPQDAVDASPQKPTSADLADISAYIREGATKRRMDPEIALKVARSEGHRDGVWQSNVMKGDLREPSFGDFQLLVGDGKSFPKGLGNDFMDKTGLDPRDPKNRRAMIDFALDTAKKDGWRQWYGAKNSGINRWDGINADQVASLDPTVAPSDTTERVPVVPVPDGFEQPDPLAETRPVQVADASKRKEAYRALSSRRIDPQQAYEVLSDPYLPAGRRAQIEALLKMQTDQDNMEREQALKQADPLYQQNIRKGEIEIRNLEKPPQARLMTEDEEKAAGLDNSGSWQILPDGSYKTVREPSAKSRRMTADEVKAANLDPTGVYEVDANDKVTTIQKPTEVVKPPSDVQEYEYAQKQGYKGSFQQWQIENKKASASQVNIGEGDKFYENLDKKNAETFATISDGGIQARAKLGQIDRLEALFAKAPQGVEGALKKIAGDWGVATEGLSDIQAASALLEKMVPEQRTPGSGPMSDADIKMFRASLPRILNQPGGNQLIFQTLRGIATYEQKMGEVADMVADRAITPAEGRKRIRELENPLAGIEMPEGPTPNEGWTELAPGVRVRKMD